jgi:hypothetical protein
MKFPRLNSYIYVIEESDYDFQPVCIVKDKVYMRNATEFITEDMMNNSVDDDYKVPLSLEEYGKRWFKTLEEAKEYVRKQFDYEIKFIPNGDDWGIEEVEE